MSDSFGVIKCNCTDPKCSLRFWPLEEGLKTWQDGDAVNTEHYIKLSLEDNLRLRAWLRKQIEEEIERS